MTRTEFLARCWAARKMGLLMDKRGILLPEDLWTQALPDVEFLLEALNQWELFELSRQFHDEVEDGE